MSAFADGPAGLVPRGTRCPDQVRAWRVLDARGWRCEWRDSLRPPV